MWYIDETHFQYQIFAVYKSMNSEMQISLRFQSRAYVYLKEYPNRALLGRAKIITFNNNQTLFQQRSSLFVELCCMLLRIQMQKSDVFVSKSVFIDHNHLIFMLYSFDATHQGKLRRIRHGNLISNIIQFYGIIFVKQGAKISDYEQNFFYQNIEGIINDLSELKDKSEEGYYEPSKEIYSQIQNGQMLINNPNSIMNKLGNSHIFNEYFYLLKVNKAIMITVLTDSQNIELSNLHSIYSEIVYLQKNLFNIIQKSTFVDDVKDMLFSYQKHVIHLLKFIQHENYIKLIKIQEENRSNKGNNYNVLDVQFCSNLRRLPSCPKTTGQRSTESSVCENNALETKEEKEQRKRQRDQFQSIKRFENEINFRVEVSYHLEKKYFVVEVEGVSQWRLDEHLYSHLFEMWTQFNNYWHNQILQSKQEIPEQIKPFKLEMLQRNKNIIIRQIFKVHQSCNLMLEIIVLVDKIAMAFLLLQKNFKRLYKVTHNIMLSDEQYEKDIKNKEYISNMVKVHKQALRFYSRHYNQLISQEKKYYK